MRFVGLDSQANAGLFTTLLPAPQGWYIWERPVGHDDGNGFNKFPRMPASEALLASTLQSGHIAP